MGDIDESMNVVSAEDVARFPESAALRFVSDSELPSDCSDNGSLSDCSDSGSSLDCSDSGSLCESPGALSITY